MRILTARQLTKLIPALFLTVALLLFATTSKGETMTTRSDIINILQKQGDKLFHGDLAYYDAIEDQIFTLPFQGLAVLTPNQIHTNKQDGFPVIVCDGATSLRFWEVDRYCNLMLAVMDVNTGKLWMVLVLSEHAKRMYPTPISNNPKLRPIEQHQSRIAVGLNHIDVLDALVLPLVSRAPIDLPWSTSTLSVTAISYDWVSNTTLVELVGDQPQVLKPQPVSPKPAESKGQALPSYLAYGKSPKTQPDSLSFTVDKALINSTHIVLQGSFSKTLRKHEIYRHPKTIRDHDTDQQVVGVVPITFAILELNSLYPAIQAINVPIYKTNMTGNKAQGYFHVDISLEYALRDEPYVVYAFMEGKVIGPVKFEIKKKDTDATKDKVEAKETFFDYVLGRLSGRS